MKKLTVLFLIIGISFLAFGIFRGEMDVVLNKGINLCLECVGIG